MPDTNQSPQRAGFNVYLTNPHMQRATSGASKTVQNALAETGTWAGSAEAMKLGRLANQYPPQLDLYDDKGKRLDQVEFHPAYHALMRKGVEHGLHASLWLDQNGEDGFKQQTRAARIHMTAGVEMGHLCPLIMTAASVAALVHNRPLLEEWFPKIASPAYDPSQKPMREKRGVTIGMGMTERQAGSDVRQVETNAVHQGDGIWRVNGHKWFMSAPMCDAFLVLAQTPDGVGCFFLPRFLPDGTANGLNFRRLKEKLGNRSNASSEVDFADSLGYGVGQPGNGIAVIMEMVSQTRLDCAVSSAGLMRTCLDEAVHHTHHRMAFGDRLIDQPVMTRVLADLCMDQTATTALVFRLAKALDGANDNPAEAAYVRLMTPVIKYWVCKLAPSFAYETMECLGGNGYVETGNLARHYREAPLNAIWEGSGNLMALDLLRVISKEPYAVERALSTLEDDLNTPNGKKIIEVIRSGMRVGVQDPGSARILTEQIAYTAAAAELARTGPQTTAAAFLETRLGGLWRSTYGMLDNRHDAKKIVSESFPEFH